MVGGKFDDNLKVIEFGISVVSEVIAFDYSLHLHACGGSVEGEEKRFFRSGCTKFLHEFDCPTLFKVKTGSIEIVGNDFSLG